MLCCRRRCSAPRLAELSSASLKLLGLSPSKCTHGTDGHRAFPATWGQNPMPSRDLRSKDAIITRDSQLLSLFFYIARRTDLFSRNGFIRLLWHCWEPGNWDLHRSHAQTANTPAVKHSVHGVSLCCTLILLDRSRRSSPSSVGKIA